jgi:hypothetical protein
MRWLLNQTIFTIIKFIGAGALIPSLGRVNAPALK